MKSKTSYICMGCMQKSRFKTIEKGKAWQCRNCGNIQVVNPQKKLNLDNQVYVYGQGTQIKK